MGFARALVALVVAAVVVAVAPAPVPAAGSAGGLLVVEGTVTDVTGTPVTGVSIVGEQEADESFHVAEVDADGHYRWEVDPSTLLQDLPVHLNVQLLGGLSYGLRVLDPWTADNPTIIDFDDVPVLAKVSGAVLDQQGRPISGALVDVASDEDPANGQVVVGEDGRYGLQVLPGSYTVHVVKAGFRPGGGPVELVAGDNTLDWTLAEPAVKPARPRLTAVRVVGPRRVRVRFAATRPGARPTGFQVACHRGGQAAGRASGRVSPLTVRRLEPGRRYRCRVRARNDAGWSAYSPYSRTIRTPHRRR